jgi:hypothetical protein
MAATTCWCDVRLSELLQQRKLESVLKEGALGEDVRAIQEHLARFGFELELMKTARGAEPAQSEDQKLFKWGKYTTRAVRMFALHPAVGPEPEKVINADGKKLTQAIAEKIQGWCQSGTRSPKNYWEFSQLKLDGTAQLVDAYGDDLGLGQQSAWHHHIRQIQEDLARVGFGVHSDAICDLKVQAMPNGKYVSGVKNDKQLTDLAYLVRKFQRQSQWLWRMKAGGTHLTDAKPALDDSTIYKQWPSGIMDQETARVLRAWVDQGLHMVLKKFELKELHWPPDSTATIPSEGGPARLRQDAYDAWLAAARIIHQKGGFLGKAFASSPRSYRGGKQSQSKGNSAFSWHYSALGIDVDQGPASWDGTINPTRGIRFVVEEEGNKFRIWCRAEPQPPVPENPADDRQDPYLQYRNRNIVTKSVPPGRMIKATDPSEPNPLFHQCGKQASFAKVAAPAAWYVDVTRILEDNGMMRVSRHSDWKTNEKAWEWWHYQYQPAPPPMLLAKSIKPLKPNEIPPSLTFGDYLQLYGIHEHKLRVLGDGWPDHSDIEHLPG